VQVVTAVFYILCDVTSNMSYYPGGGWGVQEETNFLRENVFYVNLNRYNRAKRYLFDIVLDPYRL